MKLCSAHTYRAKEEERHAGGRVTNSSGQLSDTAYHSHVLHDARQANRRNSDVRGIKERLHGSPRLINAVESTKVNRVNSSFQRK